MVYVKIVYCCVVVEMMLYVVLCGYCDCDCCE